MVKKASKKDTKPSKKAPKEESESEASSEEAGSDDDSYSGPYAVRAQSAFFMFAADKRPALLEESKAKNDGKAKVGDVAKIIGEQWAKLSDADKKPYVARAEKDKARYEKELADGLPKKPNKSKKDKKGKKKKDPNAPKRPQSAYFLWLGKNRESIIKEYKLDRSKVAEVVKKAGSLWKDVDAKIKGDFEKQAGKLKEAYAKEKAAYDAKNAAVAA